MQGAAVVSRWEWSKAPQPPPASSSASSHALLSTGHVYQLETPPAPAQAPRLLALPPLGLPASSASSSSPGLLKAPLAPLRLVAGGAAAAASAAAVSAALAAAAPAPAPLVHRPLTIPQLGQTPALGSGGALGGPARTTLTVPQLGGGASAAAAPLKLSLPQLGGGVSTSGALKLSLPGAAGASTGGGTQASPTRGTLLSLPLLGGSTQRTGAAAAPPAPPAPPVASETAAPDRGGEWRCVHWAVVGRAPVPAMALSPDGGQLALGTSAGEVVLLAPATLAREWTSQPIHGFPVTGVAFLGRTRCVVSGSADAHVAFTLLRPLQRRAPGSSSSCCGLLVQAVAWLLLALFSLTLSTGATAALSVAVARHPYVPAAASDLPPLHRALSELDRLTAGQLAVLGRGIEDWAAEGRPRLLAEQVWAAVTGGGESVLQGVGDAAAAAVASVEYVRDGAGNMLRVYYPQGESRPHNEERAARERERALADAASQALPADDGTAPQSLAAAAPVAAALSVGSDDAELEARVHPSPPPQTAEERERDAVAAAAAAARASLFDHSLNARAAAAAAVNGHGLAGQ